MAPLIVIQVMGLVYRVKTAKVEKLEGAMPVEEAGRIIIYDGV